MTSAPLILPGGDVVIPGTERRVRALIVALRKFATTVPEVQAEVNLTLRDLEMAYARIKDREARHRAGSALPAGHRLAAQVGAVPNTVPQPAMSEPQRITTSEASRLFGRSAEWWRRLAKSGVLAAVLVDGAWLVDRDAVIAYDARRRDPGRGHASSESIQAGEGRDAARSAGAAA